MGRSDGHPTPAELCVARNLQLPYTLTGAEGGIPTAREDLQLVQNNVDTLDNNWKNLPTLRDTQTSWLGQGTPDSSGKHLTPGVPGIDLPIPGCPQGSGMPRASGKLNPLPGGT